MLLGGETLDELEVGLLCVGMYVCVNVCARVRVCVCVCCAHLQVIVHLQQCPIPFESNGLTILTVCGHCVGAMPASSWARWLLSVHVGLGEGGLEVRSKLAPSSCCCCCCASA